MSNVKDVEKIDLIASDENSNKFELVMIEEREWDTDENMYYDLQEKLSNYLFFIEEGQIFEKYQELDKNVSFGIRLYGVYKPTKYATKIISNIKTIVEEKGFTFIFKVLE